MRTVFISNSRRLTWRFDRMSIQYVCSQFIHQLFAPALCGWLCAAGVPTSQRPGLQLIEQPPGRTPAVTSTVAGAGSVGLPLIIGAPTCRTDSGRAPTRSITAIDCGRLGVAGVQTPRAPTCDLSKSPLGGLTPSPNCGERSKRRAPTIDSRSQRQGMTRN